MYDTELSVTFEIIRVHYGHTQLLLLYLLHGSQSSPLDTLSEMKPIYYLLTSYMYK